MINDVLKTKTLNRKYFNAIGAANFAAQTWTSDKLVLGKQVFVAFSKEKVIIIAYKLLVAVENANLLRPRWDCNIEFAVFIRKQNYC